MRVRLNYNDNNNTTVGGNHTGAQLEALAQQPPIYANSVPTTHTTNSLWQSDDHLPQRSIMMTLMKSSLAKLVAKEQLKRWENKIPQLESSLYMSAQSYEAYSDGSTLEARLRTVLCQETVKGRQKLLSLLQHAACCQQEEGKCTLGKQCVKMKGLWKHIRNCKDGINCKEPSCTHSIQILRHYHNCRDSNCQICTPTRRECLKRKQSMLSTLGQLNHERHKPSSEPSQPQMISRSSSPQESIQMTIDLSMSPTNESPQPLICRFIDNQNEVPHIVTPIKTNESLSVHVW